MSEPTPEEIVKSFLLNAPPGEFMEVVAGNFFFLNIYSKILNLFSKDVRVLLNNDNLLNSLAPSTFREYNETQMIKIDSPKGHQVILVLLHN